MKKWILLLLLPLGLSARGEGIRFAPSSWAEAREVAAREGKLIFVDIYTRWCGPCFLMEKEVFVLPRVGEFYNKHFVNLRADAEAPGWSFIKERYGVNSYPTYLFIEPTTGDVVHASGGRQDAETFLYTGVSALHDDSRSVTLRAAYARGDREPGFLLKYIRLLSSIHDREGMQRAIAELASQPGYDLENKEVWDIFVKNIHDRNSPLSRDLVARLPLHRERHGQAAVDKKLFDLLYTTSPSFLDGVPAFAGKPFLSWKSRVDSLLRQESYEDAARLIDEQLENPGEYLRETCDFLRFTVGRAQYQELPDYWFKRCLSYARYVAYNHPDRDSGVVHFSYAILLEKAIRDFPGVLERFPAGWDEKPLPGAAEYTMRPPGLQPKPVKN
jgi:thiol-disulfide isomerase/thioredoxin